MSRPGNRAGRRRLASRPVRAALAGLVLVTGLSGCGLVGRAKTVRAFVPASMTVTSQAFSPAIPIPARYTCHGAGLSPSIHWTGAPTATKSLALIVDDSSAPITPYIYWIVFDIGPQTSGTLIGHVPTGARVADNSKGTAGYDPPCPVNSRHMYRFTVYALNRQLSLPSGVAMKTAWMAIAQATIARGRLTATANP
ncbi:MAG TPA: YbhB/YbcL family Raf kinase inhibitor-like protein [Streptosporangiaceae bacterium]|nr:YbhB/YbcL family Raf kinase inhibitor-like protein [Streptosporangiaceae bacterium]